MYVIERWLNGTIIFVSETRIKRKHSSEAVNWKNPPQVSGNMLTGQCAAFFGPLMKMPCNLITGSCSFVTQFSLHQSKLPGD